MNEVGSSIRKEGIKRDAERDVGIEGERQRKTRREGWMVGVIQEVCEGKTSGKEISVCSL